MKTPRSIYLWLALLMLLSCADNAQVPSPVLRHAILITVDTLRPDRIGAYGYKRAESRHLDALANESIRFKSAYAHSSMTCPSFASLVTGRLPARHRIYANGGSVPKDLPTIATQLHDAGFSTAAFLGNYALRPGRGFDQGFDVYTQDYDAIEAVREHPENLAGPLTDEAIDWLSKRGAEERLFLWVHYQEPHGPYTPPRFRPVDESESQQLLTESPTNSGRDAIPQYQWLGHGRVAEYESRYDGEITDFDRHLGRLLAALRERGILDQSILIFASDHGEAFGEEGLYFAHGEGLSEVLLHVPLLVRLPNTPGSVREDRVRLIDLPPTLLEVVGVDAEKFPGKNLLLDEGDRPLVAQVRSELKLLWRSYREGDYELRQKGTALPILYGAEGVSEKDADEIRTRMFGVLKQLAPWRKNPQPEALLTEEEKANLRALGYFN